MATFINFSKVVKDEDGNLTIKVETLAGIAQCGIVLEAGKLNNEVSDAVQYFVNKSVESKLSNAEIALDTAENNGESAEKIERLQAEVDELKDSLDMLHEYSFGALSDYAFVNRIALAILNNKAFRINGENKLYNALKFNGNGDNIVLSDLGDTRKAVVEILNEMFEIKECPYIKPIQVKLNLEETSKLIAIANNTRSRWTAKGIKTRTSKTIATETALQSILFVCKNCFKMVIPVKKSQDERDII